MKKTIIDLFEDSVVKYGAKTFLLEKKHRAFEPTTYAETREQALETERWNRLHPDDRARVPRVAELLGAKVAGSVSRIADFGAFVRLGSGIEGLLHVSELPGRVDHPSKVLAEGQALLVVVRSVDREPRPGGEIHAAEDALSSRGQKARVGQMLDDRHGLLRVERL